MCVGRRGEPGFVLKEGFREMGGGKRAGHSKEHAESEQGDEVVCNGRGEGLR